MNPTSVDPEPIELTRYLRRLEVALADAPGGARDEILADVRAHATDALAEGRQIDEVINALGSIGEHANQYRAGLGLPATPPTDTRRGSVMLHGAAVVVGVLTACFVAFVAPVFIPMVRGYARYTTEAAPTLVANYGLGIALLAFIPALLAVLPLVLPQRVRMPVAVANAVVVAILAVLSFAVVGMFYVPLAALMWAAVVVPWRVANGLDLAKSPLWRVFGAVLVAAPGLLLISGLLTATAILAPGVVLIVAATIVLALLFALGVRVAYYLIAALGFAVMVLAMLSPGLLTMAFWWAGGLYLAVGLSAVATLRPRRAA